MGQHEVIASPSDGLTVRYLRFNRNVIVSVLVRGATLVSGLIAASILARGLGVTIYGLWALSTTFLSYLALVDLGVNGSLVKLTGEAHAKGDRDALSNYTALAVVFYAAVGLVLTGLVFLIQGPLVRLLGVPPELRPDAGLLFITATSLLMVNNLAAVYQGPVQAVEAVHLVSLVSLITAVGNLLAAIVLQAVLRLGPEAVLLGMVATAIVTVVVSMAMYAVICRPSHWLPRRLGRASFRSMVSFSAGIQISNVAAIVNSSIDKFVLSGFVSLSATAIFDLGARPSLLAGSVSWLIVSAAYPALVRVVADQGQFGMLFGRLETFQLVAGCALAGILVALARPLVDLWLGPRFDAVVPALQVLAVARCGLVLTNLSTIAHWSKGLTRDTVVFGVGRVVLHVACSLLLVWRLGLAGALIGALLAFWIPSVWFVHRTGKVLGIPVGPWMREIVKVLAATAVATGLALLVVIVMHEVPLTDVLRWLLEAIAGAVVYALVLVGLLLVLRVVRLRATLSLLMAWRAGGDRERLTRTK